MAGQIYRIRLFGGFALERSDGEMVSLPQRRAEAILAILAVSGDMGASRERLLGLLWPESDASRARRSLRDALYAIRNTVGDDPLHSAADTLRLEPDLIESDVGAFAAALGAGHLAQAVDIYRGALLDGFHLDGAAPFERWLDGERERFFREYQLALKRLAKKAEHEDRWDAAADWWGRAVAADRFNTRLVVRRMVALARAGDRANAIQEAEAHQRLLMDELELEPDPEFLEELHRVRTGRIGPAGFYTPAPAPPKEPGPRED